MTTPILEVRNLQKLFPVKKGWFGKTRYVHAVNDINLAIQEGETVGIVGESGCGKSTLARCILRLIEPSCGEVFFQGEEIRRLNRQDMKRVRRQMQMVFQNPYDTLNPKLPIRQILMEPLIAHGIPTEQRNALIEETIEIVGLSKKHLSRYPHEFSGGQRQRIGIGRALMLRPKVIIADEPVSALDVSVQAQILNLLQDLQDKFSLTYVFISHDLHVVEHFADKVAVMYLGEVVEYGSKAELFENPLHPYTKALLSAVPVSDPDEKRERILLSGDLPSATTPPAGCKFHPRCKSCIEICKSQAPKLRQIEGRDVACHLYQ